MSGVIYPINDKKYTAEDVEIFNCTRTSGVYSVLDFDYSLSGNVLTVGKGLAWIKNGDFSGKAIAFKDVTTITLDSADDTLDRYDVIAVRYDATKTEPEIVVIKGTASETPAIPTRSTESYLYELFLCSILRKAGEGTVATSNITDLRESDYCGIMRDSVTSAVAPVYETIYEGSGLEVGKTLTFDYSKYSKYAFVIATVYNGHIDVSCDVVLTASTPFMGIQTALSGSNFVMNTRALSQNDIFFRAQIVIGSEGSTVDVCEYSNHADFSDSGVCAITKLIGVTKQPEGYVKVDSVYNPESHNAQSGEAVKQAIDEALEGFEGGNVEIPENIVEDINEIKNSIGERTYNEDITDTLTISNGFYNKTNGVLSASAKAQSTEIFKVEVGEKYFVTGAYGFYASLIVAFDENQTYLVDKSVFSSENANTTVDDYEYIVPEGVAYIGCSTRLTIAASSTTGRDLIVKKEVTELNNVQEMVKSGISEFEADTLLSVTNVCPNGNFEDTTGWATLNTGTNLTITDNIALCSNIEDNSAGIVGILQILDKEVLPQIEGNVWFISAKIKVPNSCLKIASNLNNVDGYENIYTNASPKVFDDYITICGVKRFTQSSASGTTLNIQAYFNKTTSPDFSCEIKEVTIIKDIDNSFTDEQIKNIYSNILEKNGGYIDGTVNVIGVKGSLSQLGYEYENENIITADKVVTVGENGDFQTINQALRYLSKFYPAYLDGGISCEVKILDGTIINEQIRVERVDLSHISITTDNADNTVQVDVTGWDGITHDTRGNKPFFSAEYGARLPCVKCLFSCIVPEGGWIPSKYTDDEGNEIEANVAVGYFCNRGSTGVIAGETTYSGSEANELANVGFENFYDNIIANNNSEIVLREAIARNAGRYGVMARHISRVSARSADITGCADTAAYADRSSMMDVRFADVSGSNNGLQAFNTSNMTAVETIAKNITNIVADSREGSVINCAEMTIDNVKDVFKVLNGGTIIATSTAPTNVSGTLNSKEKNTVDINGIIYG